MPCAPSSPAELAERAKAWGNATSAGPVAIRGEGLLIAILQNQASLHRLLAVARGAAEAGKLPWTAAPADEAASKAISKAMGFSPGAAGPVTIRDEALLVGIMQNQAALLEALRGAGPAALPVAPPETEKEAAAMKDKWFGGRGPGSAGPVAIRDEALIVAIARNEDRLLGLAERGAEGCLGQDCLLGAVAGGGGGLDAAPADDGGVVAMRDTWFGSSAPTSDGPVIIRDECLLAAILGSQDKMREALLQKHSSLVGQVEFEKPAGRVCSGGGNNCTVM